MSVDPAILTIAIPTYNRAQKLKAQLERLVPQLRPEVRLCVYDNGSPDETQAVVAAFLDKGVSYSRSPVNCGAHRNIFRCLENCQTEWLWTVSDDDPVTPNAVDRLLNLLKNQNCDFIHTCTEAFRFEKEIVVCDVPTMWKHTTLEALLWISSAVYRMSAFRPLFWTFNESISTCGPQMLSILALLESGGKVLLSPLVLANIPYTAAAWSTLDTLLRISLAPAFLREPANQHLLAEKILQGWFSGSLLSGLRETRTLDEIRKWKRIYRQVNYTLKAYRAHGVWPYIWRNWHQAGRRKICLSMAANRIMAWVLNLCPEKMFHLAARILPLPKNLREAYNARENFKAYI